MPPTVQAGQFRQEHKDFLAAVKIFEEAKTKFKEAGVKLDWAMGRLALGEMLQDPDDGVVYEITKPAGTFVDFHDLAYNRTRRAGESKGTLSMKAARSAGFSVGGANGE